MSQPEIKVGDSVCFSRKFLQSTHQYTGWAPFARGKVTEIEDLDVIVLATINWGDRQSKVNTRNLIHTNRRHLEPA